MSARDGTGPDELHDMPIRPTRAARLGVSIYVLSSLAWPGGIAEARLWFILLALRLAGRITATAVVWITVPRYLRRLP
jgi:hypothetical protein